VNTQPSQSSTEQAVATGVSEQVPVPSARADTEEAIVNHLRERLSADPVAEGPPRRGFAGQRLQREREQLARRHAAEAGWRIVEQGWSQQEAAWFLNLSPRTLRQWQHDFGRDLLRPLGRPIVAATREQRNEVFRIIDEQGPGIGLPTLRHQFPDLARAELEHQLRRYRRVWRRLNQRTVHVLDWQIPGSVWAVDFHGPREGIDGLDRYLLAVRDLASGRQLLWQPVSDMTAQTALAQMQALFVHYGAPLVLKSDNGSAFISELFRAGLAENKVEQLFSPARTPSYNGSIEAGIGSLTGRTNQHAIRHGRLGHWTWDDVAAALAEANATARPFGPLGPSPDEVWTSRTPIAPIDRYQFQTTVARRRQEILDAQGRPLTTHQEAALPRATDRQAISQVLVELGYLHYTRRRIPPTIRKKKAANIT
jgi:transposase InsO family protein